MLLFRSMTRRAAPWCALLLLAACSPEYNWRELDVADGQVRAAFPSRLQTDKRDILLGERRMPFTLEAANVGEAYFAVGHATLSRDTAPDSAARQRLGEALTRALYVNLRVAPPEPLPALGETVEVHAGDAEGRWSLAKVWVTRTAVIEVVALGARDSLPADRAREFLSQARLTVRP